MIYAVDVEEVRHLAETCLPPGEAVAAHLLPVVGRETPILSEHREVIRRSAGLGVHIEESRIAPCVDTLAAYADRYVPLEHDAVALSVIAGLAKLAVAVILHEIIEIDAILMGLDEALHTRLVIRCIFAPEGIVGGMVFIAQRAPHGVGTQPVAVALCKAAVFLALERSGTILGENLAQVFNFGTYDSLIVDGVKCIEMASEHSVMISTLLVGEHADSLRTQKHRMQGEDRVGAIGIGVDPCAGLYGVVDGEHLQHLLPGQHTPVYHLLDIQEIADAEVLLRADGEYRDGGAGGLPVVAVGGEAHAVDDDALCGRLRHDAEDTVGGILPLAHGAIFAEDHEFIVEGDLEAVELQAALPEGEAGVVEARSLRGIPIAEGVALAADG